MAKGDILVKRAFFEMQNKKPNLEKAFKLLERAANLENSEALYAIGTWYLHGRYVKRQPKLATEYFLRSADMNNSSAYFDMAICFEKGVGTKKDLKKAFKFYLNAALLGDVSAVYEVGRCYYYGIGITKNKSIAEIWLDHAQSNKRIAL